MTERMHSELPTVSCIIPVHNGAALISQAIESILAQQGAALEIIVVDDGSNDGSGDVAATFPGVAVYRRPQGGVAAARNDGLALATGDFIAFLDADDLWLPGKLSAQLAQIGDADYSITNVRHVKTGPDGRLPPDDGKAEGEEKLGQLMPCILARRDAFTRVGPLDTRTTTRADQDWFVRAGEAGLTHVVVDEVLTIRQHPRRQPQLAQQPPRACRFSHHRQARPGSQTTGRRQHCRYAGSRLRAGCRPCAGRRTAACHRTALGAASHRRPEACRPALRPDAPHRSGDGACARSHHLRLERRRDRHWGTGRGRLDL